MHTKGKLTEIHGPDGTSLNDEFRETFSEADARRLVACWNRLLPFSTEQIEAGIDLVKLVQNHD
jgi:hypothetical protein